MGKLHICNISSVSDDPLINITKFLYILHTSIWIQLPSYNSHLRSIAITFEPIFHQINPLRPIGRQGPHENWPMNWPKFVALPALLGWPARNRVNRHTAACVHRFSHILRWPPEPVVWFMSESRAVANEHEGYKRTLPIISSSFWKAVGLRRDIFFLYRYKDVYPGHDSKLDPLTFQSLSRVPRII